MLSSALTSQKIPCFVGYVTKRVKQLNHILSECKMLAQKEYKRRHDSIARLVDWKLCCKYDMSRGEKWYEHQPEGVVENERCKNLWDVTIQCDHVIEARRPDIVVVEKENNKTIIVDNSFTLGPQSV